MSKLQDFPRIEFPSRAALRKWLRTNHESADTFWLVTYKKHVTGKHLPYDHVVEELLCFGWVDARTNRLDDDRSMLLVAPRKPGSTWSAAEQGTRRAACRSRPHAACRAGEKSTRRGRTAHGRFSTTSRSSSSRTILRGRSPGTNQRRAISKVQQGGEESHPALDQDREARRNPRRARQRNRAAGREKPESRASRSARKAGARPNREARSQSPAMKKESVLAYRLRRHGLVSPARGEREYLELVRRLQPVTPVARDMPGSPPRLMHRCLGDDRALADGLRARQDLLKGPVLRRQDRLCAGRGLRALRRGVPPAPEGPQRHSGSGPPGPGLPRRVVSAPAAPRNGDSAQEADAGAAPPAGGVPVVRRPERRQLGPALVSG